MRIGVAADHGGFELKTYLITTLDAAGYEVVDYGANSLVAGDDYPDFVVPMARAVASGAVTRGLAICGSGVGANVAANKLPNIRAALITDSFSAHQGVGRRRYERDVSGRSSHWAGTSLGLSPDISKRAF